MFQNRFSKRDEKCAACCVETKETSIYISLAESIKGWGVGGMGEGEGVFILWHFGKKMENLRPAAPKLIILRLRHDQDSQVVIYIACKLCTSKLINQKTIILGKDK